MKARTWTALGATLSLLATAAGAKVSEEEAARLGGDLTPVGAERAGNADGSIPEWTGGIGNALAGKTPKTRVDPFGDDSVLFSIDASNVAKYEDKLSPGQIALIRRHKGYRMDVYRSRRGCSYPDWVYESTRRNATIAELTEDGVYLQKGWHPYLFPIPTSGAEAIWNHQFSFFAHGKIEHNAIIVPTKRGDMTPSHTKLTYSAPMFDPNVKSIEQAKGRAANVLVDRLAPPRLAGQVVLVHEMVNEQRRAWAYNPGQRRVRRAPTVAYDNPLTGTESLMTNDQSRMLNGLIDRFDWKIVGKREMYIPYNVFQINHGPGLKYREILGPKYPRRDLVRYELHRVWIVEATVRKGKRHLFGKRIFYLDEDSWVAAVQDIYDKKGNLWRVMEGMLAVIPEIPSCNLEGTLSYDLVAGRYVADQIKTEEKPDDWLAGRQGRIPQGVFTPDALRRIGVR